MATKFEITEYYELLALHRALHVTRFATNPPIPELVGSPFLANIAKRTVETLAQMEIERGKPERATDWQIKIDPNGEVWRIALKNASAIPSSWRKLSQEEKRNRARIFLSPFNYTDEMVEVFIRQVDEFTVNE